jgi:cytochrome c biogenesis protein CcdA
VNFINYLIDSYNIPILTSLLIGILISISPCPLATNITAIAYISKDIKNSKTVLLNGLYYTFGRAFSYTFLSIIIYFGISTFNVSTFFKNFSDSLLGPVLILIGLFMFDIINPPAGGPKFIAGNFVNKFQKYLSTKGYLGSFLLGILFAIGFCPYSAIMFFAVIIPLILKSREGILLAPFFALGTSLPVILFSFIIAFSANKIGHTFNKIKKFEYILRKLVAAIFICIGVYFWLNSLL